MEELFELIMSYVSIWAPSLVAILGTVSTIIVGIAEMKKFVDKKTLAEVYAKMDEIAAQNAETNRCNRLLLDQLTKIQNYADQKKKED